MADLADHFRLNSDDTAVFGIVGLLVGGSNIYSDAPGVARDWDGLIVVSQKRDIANLVRDSSELNRMLGIVNEEYPDFPVSASLHYNFDAVRYCGISENGIKKSVKILSLEHLSSLLHSQKPSTVRILSRKNIRVYKATQYARLSLRLQPAVTLDAHTYLLHDADIYVASLHMNAFQYVALGATMDLLVTGKWFYATPAVTRLSTDLLAKLTKLPNLRLPEDWTLFFARGERFSPHFRESLRSQSWASLLDTVATVDALRVPTCLVFWHPGVFAIEQDILDHEQYLRTPQIRYRFLGHIQINRGVVCHRDVDAGTVTVAKCGSIVVEATRHARSLYAPTFSQFSSNSTSGSIVCGSRKLFWKIPTVMTREIAGAYLSAPYGLVHLPVSLDVSNGILLYPFFAGRSLAEMRLDHLRGVRDDLMDLMEVEMRRSEDMLTGYCGTVRVGFPDSTIQQFFSHRLANGSRLQEFYHAGLSVDRVHCSLADFLQLPIIINGAQFPPLRMIIDAALSMLQSSEETTIVTGMGDSHSGNVMVSNARPMKVIYVDYEAAGHHSPWLDFAKPLYNDVFFEALYADLVGRDFRSEGVFEATISPAGISIMIGDLKFNSTARLMWEIKRRLVLEPFSTYLLHNNLSVHNSMQILGNALFCCAVFTRNFKDQPDIFLVNLALGVLLTQGGVSQVVDLICPNHDDI